MVQNTVQKEGDAGLLSTEQLLCVRCAVAVTALRDSLIARGKPCTFFGYRRGSIHYAQYRLIS
jgi:hypothetical protein